MKNTIFVSDIIVDYINAAYDHILFILGDCFISKIMNVFRLILNT